MWTEIVNRRTKLKVVIWDFVNSDLAFEKIVEKLVASVNSVSELIGLSEAQQDLKYVFTEISEDLEESFPVSFGALTNFLKIIIECVRSDDELLPSFFVVNKLASFFDAFPVNVCEPLFTLLESYLPVWNSPKFSVNDRHVVLKICNVLLQRLSKTQHTEFCGRVLIFLSKLFPISEQSGVNKYGEFNVDNTTIFDAKSDEDEISEKNELPETIVKLEDVDGHVIVDHEFYKKFWLLQTYFSSPANCYQSHQFAEFQHCAVAVLDTLSHEKARAVNTPPEADVVGIDVTPLPMYPKFLTSRRLIGLQLQDPVFRAIIIFQMLILFQFLLNPSSKFCHSAVLSAEALEWVKKTHERCLVMASQIRQHGKSCRGTVTHMLERERAWCEWKEQNCPSFDAQNKTFPLLERRTQTLEDRLRKRSFLGSKELSELFKRTDAANYEQLKKNNFVPDFDEFFEEALEQVSEDACIEEEYLLWHNSVWVARAVRLLTKANPAVFEFMKGGTIVEAVRYLQEKAKSQSREEPANDACSLGEESELEQCGDKRPRLEGSSEALK